MYVSQVVIVVMVVLASNSVAPFLACSLQIPVISPMSYSLMPEAQPCSSLQGIARASVSGNER